MAGGAPGFCHSAGEEQFGAVEEEIAIFYDNIAIDNPAVKLFLKVGFSQNLLNALAVDEPLEYARLALDGEMQAWVDAVDSLEVW